jgi:hypothetical protein
MSINHYLTTMSTLKGVDNIEIQLCPSLFEVDAAAWEKSLVIVVVIMIGSNDIRLESTSSWYVEFESVESK